MFRTVTLEDGLLTPICYLNKKAQFLHFLSSNKNSFGTVQAVVHNLNVVYSNFCSKQVTTLNASKLLKREIKN
jgi:hypothetical protein